MDTDTLLSRWCPIPSLLVTAVVVFPVAIIRDLLVELTGSSAVLTFSKIIEECCLFFDVLIPISAIALFDALFVLLSTSSM